MDHNNFIYNNAVLLIEAVYISEVVSMMDPRRASVILQNIKGVENRVAEILFTMKVPLEKLQGVLNNELRSRVMPRVIVSLNEVNDGRIPILEHWSGNEPPLESYTQISSDF